MKVKVGGISIDKIGKNLIDHIKKNAKGYAVFDWDNTCIVNDITETMFYQFIDNWEFNIKVSDIDRVILGGMKIPQDIITLGKRVSEIYKKIENTESVMINEFRVKIIKMYQELCKFDEKIAYVWVSKLFTGHTDKELNQKVVGYITQEIKRGVTKETYIHNEDSVEVTRGIVIKEDFLNLFRILKANGVKIYVCSASFEPLVKIIATNKLFGYNLNKENIYGMRLKKEGEIYVDAYVENYPLVVKEGKSEIIDKYIKQEGDPYLVAGDSDGDFNMLTEYTETNISLLVNASKNTKVYNYFIENKSNFRYQIIG